ncbi:hypothetical protein KCV07_g120, partial [Aureobasidium melanogenum]
MLVSNVQPHLTDVRRCWAARSPRSVDAMGGSFVFVASRPGSGGEIGMLPLVLRRRLVPVDSGVRESLKGKLRGRSLLLGLFRCSRGIVRGSGDLLAAGE